MGRPTKYRKEFCDIVPKLMAKGWSKTEVCAKLGVQRATLLAWQAKHSPFLNAVKKGEELSKAWWMAKGRNSMNDASFNSTLWYMNMKNRHGWADKKEVKLGGEVDLNVNKMSEERKAELQELAKLRSTLAIEKVRDASTD